MNKEQVKGSWNELKGKIRQNWGDLTNDDLEKAKGNLQELSGALQKRYGYSKEQAKKELESFQERIQHAS